MSDIAKTNGGNGHDVTVVDGDYLMRLALDPGVTAEKLQVVANVVTKAREDQRRWEREDREEAAKLAFRADKARMTAELPVVEKVIPNTQAGGKFVDVGDAWEAFAPIVGKYGFSIDYDVLSVDGNPALQQVLGYLDHKDGHRETRRSPPFMADTTGPKGTVNKTELHGMQSAITYVSRGVLFRLLGTHPKREDDDGNAGAGSPQGGGGRPPPPPRPEYQETGLSQSQRLARGDRKTVDEFKEALGRRGSIDGLQELLDEEQDAIESMPPAIRTDLNVYIAELRKELLTRFDFPVLDAFGEATHDGQVYTTKDAWRAAFLLVLRPAVGLDRDNLRHHNAEALGHFTPEEVQAIAATVPMPDAKVEPETNAAGPFDDDYDPDEDWAKNKLAEIAPLKRSLDDHNKLLRIARAMKADMDRIKRENRPLYDRVNKAFNEKHAATKPVEDPR